MNELPLEPTLLLRSSAGTALIASGSSILISLWTEVTSRPQQGQITVAC